MSALPATAPPVPAPAAAPRLAILFDPPDENWISMELVAEALLGELQACWPDLVEAHQVQPSLVSLARRLPLTGSSRLALNVDRLFGRWVDYPLRLRRVRTQFDLFHVSDHSYSQLVHALPAERTGVYCHDLNAFRSLFDPVADARPEWFRRLALTQLRGIQKAAVVFYSTQAVRQEIEAHDLIDPSRLVHAPFGTSAEFTPVPDPDDGADALLAPLEGRPFLLHVGSSVPRKRLEVLFEVFAELRRHHPDLWLVQQGAQLTDEQRRLVDRLGIGAVLLKPPRLPRRAIAGLYRRASAVLLPSDMEGFGLPVIEALACGAPLVASDLPVLREVGGEAALFCPVGEVAAWTKTLLRLLQDPTHGPPQAARLERAAHYSWRAHARIIADAYRRLL
jgi:glycosyltransferase involved in cell wall biosynthesis